jgi:hypothetical protein
MAIVISKEGKAGNLMETVEEISASTSGNAYVKKCSNGCPVRLPESVPPRRSDGCAQYGRFIGRKRSDLDVCLMRDFLYSLSDED